VENKYSVINVSIGQLVINNYTAAYFFISLLWHCNLPYVGLIAIFQTLGIPYDSMRSKLANAMVCFSETSYCNLSLTLGINLIRGWLAIRIEHGWQKSVSDVL
jgi:hypothetical protein